MLTEFDWESPHALGKCLELLGWLCVNCEEAQRDTLFNLDERE